MIDSKLAWSWGRVQTKLGAARDEADRDLSARSGWRSSAGMARHPRVPEFGINYPGLPSRSMRIATWNVNSVKQRVPRLLPWLDERQPDVVCLQETKLPDDALAELFGDELAGRGYQVAAHGEVAWNGVAILSRVGLDEVVAGLAGGPGFPNPEARAVAATCGGIRVHSVHVPDGRVPGPDHYE